MDLPPVPDFALRPASADGARSVRSLRVARDASLGREVAVRGIITWVYDCATEIRRRGESVRQVRRRIDADPTLCQRPKFYVGDTRDAPPDRSLWVVDVPRPWNKLEVERIPRADRDSPDRCEPNDPHPARLVCPPYRVGDEVLVVGTFATESPHAERNSDGLLVYQAMKNVTQKWETTGGATIPPAGPPAAARAQLPSLPAPPRIPMRAVVPRATLEASVKDLARANRAMAANRLTDAIEAYNQAVAGWSGNHLAWYGLGGALGSTGDWHGARDAFQHAATLRPDSAMYELWLGVALYEDAVALARLDRARLEQRNVDEVVVDLSAIDFRRALQHLEQAARLEPGLWRAQYYIGRIRRARGEDHEAAVAFSRAMAADPYEPGPCIALVELYRKWDYTEAAIKVAVQGTTFVPASDTQAADLWFVRGLAYDDHHQDDEAIEAYSRALEIDATFLKARFQRGQLYFRKGDRARAKADLAKVAASQGPGLGFARIQASQMLDQLARKRRP